MNKKQRPNAPKKVVPFDKYEYYFRSVQDPDQTIDFIEKVFQKAFGKPARVLGEDFCGTFAMSCTWVERRAQNTAVGVDLDAEPIKYGMLNYFSQLTKEQQKRLYVYQSDVRNGRLRKVDCLAAMNFSYFIFKKRTELLQYFKNCHRRLNTKGLLLLDCFGGIECVTANLDVTKFKKFTYFWDQTGFDPITHHALFYIHYKRPGEKKRERVFRYDWRMWTLPELKELLAEAGFKDVVIHWEGTTAGGEGNNRFLPKAKSQNETSWVVYITARK
jgi:SAM-dependent methyltransferase